MLMAQYKREAQAHLAVTKTERELPKQNQLALLGWGVPDDHSYNCWFIGEFFFIITKLIFYLKETT
jgi:hypothetical protein